MATDTTAAEKPAATRKFGEAERVLKGIKRGDQVRLLLPIWDGVQRKEAGELVFWPFDDPPLENVAAYVGSRDTHLDAPVTTTGRPPDDYVDPSTGQKPIIESS